MQALTRATTKALAILCICTSVSAEGQLKNSSSSDLSRLDEGRMGELFIGMPPAQIEKKLHRSLALQFAGEGRAGLTLERPAELQKIRLRTFMGAPVESIDVIFAHREGALQIDFISIGIPCQAVTSLQDRVKAIPHAARPEPAHTSRTASQKQHFRWGAESKPSCRVWLSEA